MAKYSVDGTQAIASPDDTTLNITCDSLTVRRGKIVEFTLGSDGAATAADTIVTWTAQRCTTQGTNTSVVPLALNPADAVALTNAGENHTAEPTYTADAVLFKAGLHMRATYRWVAAPGAELVFPATANNGIGWFPTHASATHLTVAHALFEEQ